MPIYAFKCQSCGHEDEFLQRYDDPAPACERCGGPTARQLTAPAIHMGEHAAVPRGSGGSPKVSNGRDVYDGLMEAAQKGPEYAQEYTARTGGIGGAQVAPVVED